MTFSSDYTLRGYNSESVHQYMVDVIISIEKLHCDLIIGPKSGFRFLE